MSDRILFDCTDEEYLKLGNGIKMKIKIPVSCPVTRAFLMLEKDGENGHPTQIIMTAKGTENGYAVFVLDTPFPAGLYFFSFLIVQPNNSFRLFRYGVDDNNIEDGKKWQLTVTPQDYNPSEKYLGSVMYQIFPDRFAIGGDVLTEGKLEPFRLHNGTDEPPDVGPDGMGVWNSDFYGGNFRGITEKLGYIKSLGVSVIYLNPIFKAQSNHRYDTFDYLSPDPMLGSEDDFSSLCSAAHREGISVILDGVFSHTGKNSLYFSDAVSNPASPFRSWYSFIAYPDRYECWWDVKTLPCVNELEPSYLKFITEQVIPKWLDLGADGFRLDVADELPDEFIAELRRAVKSTKKDALLIGEVWEDASNKISYGKRRRYFSGGELDGVMNYPFRNSVIAFAKGLASPKKFREQILAITSDYPYNSLLSSTVFLSSHDTPRLYTELDGDLNKIETAVAIQTFLPGIMSIFYGDEIGAEGGGDPLNRAFFLENGHSEKVREIYSRYLPLRKHDALKTGKLKILTDGGLKIVRCTDTESVTLTVGEGHTSVSIN